MLIMLSDQPRAFARGRMVGRMLDRLEWTAGGILRRLFHGTPEQSGERGKARGLEVVRRESGLPEHLDDCGTGVDGSRVIGHATSYLEGD